MGIPKQVAEMEAEGDAELNAAQNPQVENPADKSDVQEATEQQPNENRENAQTAQETDAQKTSMLSSIGEHSATDKELRKQAQRDASAQGRLDKLNGQLKAQREAYEGKIAELESRIRDLDGKLNSMKIGGATPASGDTDDEIFAEIRKEYSEEDYSDDDLKRFIGVINRVGRHNIKAFEKRFDEIDAERAERAKRAAEAEAEDFKKRLDADFPGFRELDANNDPRWIGFLESSLGGVMEGTSYGDIAKDALGKLDYRKFSSVVREFAKHANIVFSPNGKPADGSVAGQIRPKSVAAPQRDSTTPAHPRVVPRAEIEAFRRAAFAHRAEERYGLTHEQVAEQLRFYEDAEAEGRVS